MHVSILGGGAAGSALAFHLVQLGHEVLLYRRQHVLIDSHKITAVEKKGDVDAAMHGVALLSKATSCMKEALDFSNYIMVVVPAFAQKELFEATLPHLTKEHILISIPGNFAFLDYMDVLHQHKDLEGEPNVHEFVEQLPVCGFVELSTTPHASRMVGDNQVFIGVINKLVHVGVIPSYKTDHVLDLIQPFFLSTLEKTKNVIETGFCNLNFIIHPVPMIYNAGWIESTNGDFLFYKQGMSPSVVRLIEKIDEERIAVAASLDMNVETVVKTLGKWYDNDVSEIPGDVKVWQFIKAPNSLENRYVTEDLCYILLPIIHYIAKQKKILTPLSDALITSASVMMGRKLEPQRHFYGSLDDYDKFL